MISERTRLASLFVCAVHLGLAAPRVDFQREVRPIVSDACFLCHGPDKNTRMVDLRLDTKAGALAKRKAGAGASRAA